MEKKKNILLKDFSPSLITVIIEFLVCFTSLAIAIFNTTFNLDFSSKDFINTNVLSLLFQSS